MVTATGGRGKVLNCAQWPGRELEVFPTEETFILLVCRNQVVSYLYEALPTQ